MHLFLYYFDCLRSYSYTYILGRWSPFSKTKAKNMYESHEFCFVPCLLAREGERKKVPKSWLKLVSQLSPSLAPFDLASFPHHCYDVVPLFLSFFLSFFL